MAEQKIEGIRALVMSYADCTHYLIGTTRDAVGETKQVKLLRDESGTPLRYRNAQRAQLALQEMGFSDTWMLMQSAYDEMIGNDSGCQAELPLPQLITD